MGGFMQHHDNGPPTVLEAKDVPSVVKRRTLEVEIQDKSKGDGLSKTLALVQTMWFLLQCISRGIEGIPVTELEVATCAFALLNFATYLLWWNKPLNVSRPVLIYQDDKELEDRITNEGQECRETGTEEEVRVAVKERGYGQSLKRVREAFIRGLVDIPKDIYRAFTGSLRKFGGLQLPLGLIWPISTGTSFASNDRVGTFGPKLRGDVKDWLTSAAVGIVFGGIHCAAWRFQFPSPIERLLWRVSAISVTGGPFLMGLLALIRVYSSGWRETLSSISLILVLILYIFARLTLLVLSFMTLRSLPSGAFRTANWTRFIPHFA
jgi:hypothetical protein